MPAAAAMIAIMINAIFSNIISKVSFLNKFFDKRVQKHKGQAQRRHTPCVEYPENSLNMFVMQLLFYRLFGEYSQRLRSCCEPLSRKSVTVK